MMNATMRRIPAVEMSFAAFLKPDIAEDPRADKEAFVGGHPPVIVLMNGAAVAPARDYRLGTRALDALRLATLTHGHVHERATAAAV